jgi:hypothetical protein
MHALHRILLTLLLLMASVANLLAEGRLAWLPEYFQRVTNLTDVVDGGYYLIAGTSQRDGHVLMSGEVVNQKLVGIAQGQQERILCDNEQLVWQLHRTGNDIIIRAAHSGQYVYAPQSHKPEVELHASRYTTWTLQQKDDGFVLKHPDESYRYLHTSFANKAENPNPFGNYAYYEGTVETNVLYFYKVDAHYEAPVDNSVTYLKQGDKVPVYGNLIVKDGKLLYPSVLFDGVEFIFEQPFTIEDGQLAYTRTLQDGNWETLALPFSASVPDGVEARELWAAEDGKLIFNAVAEIRPHVPVIIRSLQNTPGNITFVSNVGQVTPPKETDGTFCFTYERMAVSSSSGLIFLLSASGQSFVLADSGSSLRPFRAYIKGVVGWGTQRMILK